MLSEECALKHILKNHMMLIDNHQMKVWKDREAGSPKEEN